MTYLIVTGAVFLVLSVTFLLIFLLSKHKKKNSENKKIEKAVKKNNDTVQSVLKISSITDNHIERTNGEKLYFIAVKPNNLSVLSNKAISSLITCLSNLISQAGKIELFCTDSSQSYNDNLLNLKDLAKKETNPLLRQIDEEDIRYLDNIRANTATSRAFYIVIRYDSSESITLLQRHLNSVIQIAREQKLNVHLAMREEIKKLTSIYLEQNIYDDNPPNYDGESYINETQKQTIPGLKDYVDLIAPSVMDFKHADYYIIGNTYRKTIAVRGYAATTTQQALLKALGEKEGITLHIYNRVVTPEEHKKIIDASERRNNAKLKKANKLREKTEGLDNLSDLQKILTETHKNNEKLIHCVVYIEMSATSQESLKTLSDSVNQTLVDNRMLKDNLLLQQKNAFLCASPFGENLFKTEFERVLPSSSVANLYPFSYSGKTDPRGNVVGKDVNGAYILTDFDQRASDKTNGHISIFGNSGEGKSWLTKLLICLFRQKGKLLYSIDVESEFYDITENLGGTNINMMSGKYFINILEPKLLKDISNENTSIIDDKEISAITKTTLLSQHIAFLRDFFKVYKPEITSSQLDILEIMIVKVYERFHINEGTNLNELNSRSYPILEDLYKVVKESLDNYDKDSENRTEMLYTKENLRGLLLAINSICIGNDSIYFNGHTNIPNADHINFGIQEMLNTNENLKNAMYLNIFSFMQHRYFQDGNTVVICDEIHEIVKSMIVVMYIRSFVKRGRKRDSNILTASQNIEDLMLPGIIEYTMPLFSIPTHRFLFYPGNVDVQNFIRTTNIAENEFDLIATPHQGFCLYSCGDERYHLHVIAPEHKAKLFGLSGGK